MAHTSKAYMIKYDTVCYVLELFLQYIVVEICHCTGGKNTPKKCLNYKGILAKLLKHSSCISENPLQVALLSQLFLHLSREVLSGLTQCFGGKESRCSHRASQESISPLKLVTDSKVCYLDVSVFSHQQIRRFDVSVDDPLVVYC